MTHPSPETLSAHLDGDLDAATRDDVARHVTSCGECQAKLDELRALVRTLQDLPDAPPRQDLWRGIRSRLSPPKRLGHLAVAASVLLMLAASGLVLRGPWWSTPPPERASSTRALELAHAEGYLEAIRDMEEALDELEAALDPASTTLVRREIAVLDEAIAEIRLALLEDPENPWLHDSLARSLRSKWTYLRDAPVVAPSRVDVGG